MPKIIQQRFGAGDVCFSMGAIRSLGDKIVWPLLPDYVQGCRRAYPDIEFMDWRISNVDFNRRDRYFIHEYEVIPLAWQDVPLKDAMKNKYSYFGLSWQRWKDNSYYNRNGHRELALREKLGLVYNEPYNLINFNFGTNINTGEFANHKIHFDKVDNGLKNINMKPIEGFSLFDWSLIIEEATNIYTVSTSILYLLELLSLRAKEIHLYPRKPQEIDFRNVDYLFTKPYILHS